MFKKTPPRPPLKPHPRRRHLRSYVKPSQAAAYAWFGPRRAGSCSAISAMQEEELGVLRDSPMGWDEPQECRRGQCIICIQHAEDVIASICVEGQVKSERAYAFILTREGTDGTALDKEKEQQPHSVSQPMEHGKISPRSVKVLWTEM
jgi:hypothetical protein